MLATLPAVAIGFIPVEEDKPITLSNGKDLAGWKTDVADQIELQSEGTEIEFRKVEFAKR